MKEQVALSLASVLILATGLRAQVVVNEVSASNLTTVADNFGDFGDWAECTIPLAHP
ncbi:MAG: hypothetical protein IPO17_16040 [Flavobacteriales bacterium]|nr:hypothetical protein [Flavobacteriales bacterium]